MITRVFLLTGFSLIFICTQSVSAILQGKWFFDCKNGQQIPFHMKCDAHIDCTDGSDETFVECHKVICPEFACSYGGCYMESQQCDGNEDCWDHTDEHQEYCSPNTTIPPAIDNGLWPRCGKNQFKCVKSSECQAIERVCDGIRDCQDGSDETHQNCPISKCTNETFRCAYGGCLARTKVCDDVVHCWDKSDELPAICSENRTSPWGIYDDSPKRVVRDTQKNSEGCMVPKNMHKLQVRTLFNVLPYHVGVPLASSTVVRVSCLNNTERNGPDINQCLDGQWLDPWPECMETCRRKFSRDTSIKAVCQYKNEPITNCNQKYAKLFAGTNAYISCAPSYIPKGNVIPSMVLKCTKGSDPEKRPYWSNAAKRKPLQCVPDCGKIHSAEFPRPWSVSLFTSDIYHQKFTFQGIGYIISPWAVLVSIGNVSTDDVLRYAVAEGHHKVEFTEYDEQAYQLHSVKTIFRSEIHAVLGLVNPFILSPSVRPLCLPPIPKNVPYNASNNFVSIKKNGQDIWYIKNIEEDIIRHSKLIVQQEKSIKTRKDK